MTSPYLANGIHAPEPVGPWTRRCVDPWTIRLTKPTYFVKNIYAIFSRHIPRHYP